MKAIRTTLVDLLASVKIEMPSVIELRNAKVCLIKEIHGREQWLKDRGWMKRGLSDFDKMYDSDIDLLELYNHNVSEMQEMVMKESFGITRHKR